MANHPGTKICDTILDTIGNTPLVRINRITRGVTDATVLAKIETFNPGNSIKDRMAVKMIEDAERSGQLKPGGTIIEGTSGNTGMGLAIAAVVKGYQCIFTTTDKQSKEKIDALKAFGAEVIVCPTDVDPEDPRSYYSVSSRLEREIPNAWKANQYDNLSNTAGALRADGPEIWEQTDGTVTHLVVGRRHRRHDQRRRPLSEGAQPGDSSVWGIDTYGSVFKKYKETGIFDKNEIYPYITEGIGEDFLPEERRLQRHRSLREGHRQGRRDHDAAPGARGGHLRRQLGRRGDGRAAPARRPLHKRRRRRRDLPRPRLALSRQDVQRRVDAREGLPRGHGHDRARPRGARRLGRALRRRGRAAGRGGRADDERARLLADLGDQERPHRRLAERDAPLRGVRPRPD